MNAKVAIVHDAILNMGGAERVVGVLHECFPDAPIYTSVYLPDRTHSSLVCADVRTTFMQRIAKGERVSKALFPLSYFAMDRLNVDDYDLVLSSSTFCAKNVNAGVNARHVCYCYAPFRPVWDFDRYTANLEWNRVQKFLARHAFSHFRRYDFDAAQKPDQIIGISRYAAEKIQRAYHRTTDAIIYPPVDVESYRCDLRSEEYFLVVSRLLAYKRVDIVIQAFNELGYPLKIIGTGADMARLRHMARPNVEFVGSTSENTLRDYYARCRCLVFPGEEDFGLTPIEAHASGKPVIAYARGGALETVVGHNTTRQTGVEGSATTGVFFFEPSPEAVVQAVRVLDGLHFDPLKVRERALRFDKSQFRNQIMRFLANGRE